MSDVGERASVNNGRGPFGRLHQIGLDRLLEQNGHRVDRADLRRGDRFPGHVAGHNHTAKPPFQIVRVFAEAQHRHNLRSASNHKAGFMNLAVPVTQPDDDLPKTPVVHIHRALPQNAPRVDLQCIPLKNVVVDHRREQVIRGSDRVQVAGKMQINILGR